MDVGFREASSSLMEQLMYSIEEELMKLKLQLDRLLHPQTLFAFNELLIGFLPIRGSEAAAEVLWKPRGPSGIRSGPCPRPSEGRWSRVTVDVGTVAAGFTRSLFFAPLDC